MIAMSVAFGCPWRGSGDIDEGLVMRRTVRGSEWVRRDLGYSFCGASDDRIAVGEACSIRVVGAVRKVFGVTHSIRVVGVVGIVCCRFPVDVYFRDP